MKNRLILLILTIPQLSSACGISKNDVVGSYTYEKGSAFFEDFELNADGEFSSWLHQRPASTGRWGFENCRIKVSLDDFAKPLVLYIEFLDREKAIFHTEGHSEPASYKRGST